MGSYDRCTFCSKQVADIQIQVIYSPLNYNISRVSGGILYTYNPTCISGAFLPRAPMPCSKVEAQPRMRMGCTPCGRGVICAGSNLLRRDYCCICSLQ